MRRPAAQWRRDAGLYRLRRAQRWLVAATVGATGVVTATLWHSLPGRTANTSAGAATVPATTTPPTTSPASASSTTGPQPSATAPTTTTAPPPPVVISGGS